MSLDPGFKFRKFLFSPNYVLNFRKSYQILRKLALEQKFYRQKKQFGGGKQTPRAYRINVENIVGLEGLVWLVRLPWLLLVLTDL